MIKTLIADDFKKWHDVAERNLSYFGFREFLHAYTIKEGLVLYEAHRPDLVITDINFGPSKPTDVNEMSKNLDGLVLCKQIRDQNKDARIVVMSSDISAKELAMANGANYFIQKPHFKDQIEDFIRLYSNTTKW